MILTGILLCFPAHAAAPAKAQSYPDWVGRLVSVQGLVEVRRSGTHEWQPALLGEDYRAGDTLRAGPLSRAALLLRNQTTVRLDQNTSLTFQAADSEEHSLLNLIKGAVYFFTPRPRSLDVHTPFVNASVEGTEFYLRVGDAHAELTIYTGQVRATNPAGSLLLSSGQSAAAAAGQAPAARLVTRPRDAVQWALFYPPVLAYDPAEAPPAASWLAASLTCARIGDYGQALAALERLPVAGDPSLLTYRASLYLHLGRAAEAAADIASALLLDPAHGEAYALKAVIALVHNEPQSALDLAEQALSLAPRAAGPAIARSYALQALFRIEEAVETVCRAVEHQPGNALARARLAELRLMQGYLDKALDEARQAAGLDPALARTQTVLGYAHLAAIRTAEARASFLEAIRLNSADPLPRLGLGLAIIRDGDLAQGRGQIEIAACLDPGSALVRSYLGKAYFDERREGLAGREFATAKELDPNDPTPYFYDAILKQTTNRPVEALEDLETSIALNDNRAVYRSRLLLDADLAARSASLGRIYRDLGFEQAALVEGWKSVNTDQSDFSAHRFLAETYSVLPGYEIARVNEVLQSQLLQPLNVNPVPPTLYATNLFILEGSGPSDPAFNEFNPLFQRNRAALQYDGLAGNLGTLSNELIVSGIQDKVSFNLSQFHYETDGFRDNNDRTTDLLDAFVQASLTPETSIQGEYRWLDFEQGWPQLTFQGFYLDTFRQEERADTGRFGIRHAPSPSSDLLGSFIYQEGSIDTVIFPGWWEIYQDIKSFVGEAAYLFHPEGFELTAGLGYRSKETRQEEVFFFTPTPSKNDVRFMNAYAYGQFQPHPSLDLTLGLSGDRLEGDVEGADDDQLNPKLGLVWNPWSATTIRGAAFRAMVRPYFSPRAIDPSLEPTQVAGFNQFYLSAGGDSAWRYGLALDQKLPFRLYAGAELLLTDGETVFDDSGANPPRKVRRDQDFRNGRAYLYWAPATWLALSAEYLYEWMEADVTGGFYSPTYQAEKIRTQRVVLGARYFHPFGFTLGATASYVDQEGDFIVPNPTGDNAIVPDGDSFWVADASLSYRLPRRYGVLSLEGKNLFDEEFKFQDTDPANPRIMPDRLLMFKFTLSF